MSKQHQDISHLVHTSFVAIQAASGYKWCSSSRARGTELSSQDLGGSGRRIMSSRQTLIIQQCSVFKQKCLLQIPKEKIQLQDLQRLTGQKQVEEGCGSKTFSAVAAYHHKTGSYICLLNHVHLKRRTSPLILVISLLSMFLQLSAFLPPSLMCITKRNSHYSL